MIREIAVEIDIHAPARYVWNALVDFPRYPEWNPFLLKITGEARAGTKIRFWFELPRGFRAPACARILTVEPEKELRWAGGLRGVLRAEHYMLIESLDDSRVRFRHGEIFTGVLTPLIWLVLASSGPPVYEDTNVALKRRAEDAFRSGGAPIAETPRRPR
jgi:hypothetical protein